MPFGDKGSGLEDKGSCSVYKSDYSYSTREPVGCLRDCRCIAVRLALACGMVRAAAVYDVLASSIRGRPAQFNTNNVLRTKACGSCYRWLARSVCPRLSSGRSLGSGARRLFAAARRLGATTSGTACSIQGVTGQHEECESQFWCGRVACVDCLDVQQPSREAVQSKCLRNGFSSADTLGSITYHYMRLHSHLVLLRHPQARPLVQALPGCQLLHRWFAHPCRMLHSPQEA
jgi:hypothetical protein